MFRVAKRVFCNCAAPIACVVAALWTCPARAQSDVKIFTDDTVELIGDVRFVAADGQKSWLDGGFGKLRSGSDGNDFKVRPELGNVSLVWQPQFGWALSGTVVTSVQGGERTQFGLSQAYLTFKPMRGGTVAFSARAGLMWPAVSLEHEGADWHVRDSITPSAINSWIAEEVRPVAVEATVAANFGEHKVRATAAIMAANDTSGTLLTFRGWALHDTTTLAFNRQPLPPLDDDLKFVQAPFTHPLLDVPNGFAHRPGYYAKLSWQPPATVRFELFHYDNRANPEDVNPQMEWGWRTKFTDLGVVADLGSGTQIKAQALSGHTQMGFTMDGARFVDNRFRSAFAMLVQSFGKFGIAVRAEGFDTHNRGSLVDNEYDETGWSAMIAGKRVWGSITGLIELLHVSSRREDWGTAVAVRQRQTQLQAELRIHR
jgi:hypothetical protein